MNKKRVLLGNLFHNTEKAINFLEEDKNLLKNPYINGIGIVEIDTLLHIDNEIDSQINLEILNNSMIERQKINCHMVSPLRNNSKIPVTIHFMNFSNNSIDKNINELISTKNQITIKFISISKQYVEIANEINLNENYNLIFSHHFSRIDEEVIKRVPEKAKLMTMNREVYNKIRKYGNRVLLDRPYNSYFYLDPQKLRTRNKEFTIFFPSNFSPLKGADNLINFLIQNKNLLDSYKKITLKFALSEEIGNKIKDIFEESTFDFNIKNINRKNHWYDLPEEYYNVDCLMYYGSQREGFGFVPFESISLGCPALAIGHSPSVEYLVKNNYPYSTNNKKEYGNIFRTFVRDVGKSELDKMHNFLDKFRGDLNPKKRIRKILNFIHK